MPYQAALFIDKSKIECFPVYNKLASCYSSHLTSQVKKDRIPIAPSAACGFLLLGSITCFLSPPSNVPQADFHALAEIIQGEIKNVTTTIITTVNN